MEGVLLLDRPSLEAGQRQMLEAVAEGCGAKLSDIDSQAAPPSDEAMGVIVTALRTGERALPARAHQFAEQHALPLVALCADPLAGGASSLKLDQVVLIGPRKQQRRLEAELGRLGFALTPPPFRFIHKRLGPVSLMAACRGGEVSGSLAEPIDLSFSGPSGELQLQVSGTRSCLQLTALQPAELMIRSSRRVPALFWQELEGEREFIPAAGETLSLAVGVSLREYHRAADPVSLTDLLGTQDGPWAVLTLEGK